MIHLASGTKWALPAEVPGSSTKTFFALLGPTLMMPTLSYLAGVPGAAKPCIHVTPSGLVGGLDPQLETSTAMHPTAIGMSSALFKLLRLTFTSYHAVGFIHRPQPELSDDVAMSGVDSN